MVRVVTFAAMPWSIVMIPWVLLSVLVFFSLDNLTIAGRVWSPPPIAARVFAAVLWPLLALAFLIVAIVGTADVSVDVDVDD